MVTSVRPPERLDATSYLTLYVCVLLAIPAPLQVAALGSAGSPANLMSIATFLWWAWYQLQRNEHLAPDPQPVRRAMTCFVLVLLVAYAHAMASPMVSSEVSPADSGMLRALGMCGLLFVANDGIGSIERLRTLARRLVIAGGVIGALGLLQYVTKEPIVDRLSIPGLTEGPSSWGLAARSGLTRPSGTSTHPIEFGAVLTLILPLAIVHAQHARERLWLYRIILAVISFAIFLCISRSAMICAVVGVSVLAASWSARARLRGLGFALVMFTIVYLTTPGILGTITRLFTGISGDNSVESRTDSYEVAAQFISRSPVIGRGFGTFLPEYWILDNQYLGLLIEGGFVALVALLVLLASAAHASRRAARRLPEEFDRHLVGALFASTLAGSAGLAFFDTFSFPQSAGVLFLILGMGGGALRLQRADERARRVRADRPRSAEPSIAKD